MTSVSERPAVVPMPHQRYKIQVESIGEGDGWIVFGTHDVERAAEIARPEVHELQCYRTELPACPDCVLPRGDARVGWWRQRPAGPNQDYLWWLLEAEGPGPGVRPAVYFRA